MRVTRLVPFPQHSCAQRLTAADCSCSVSPMENAFMCDALDDIAADAQETLAAGQMGLLFAAFCNGYYAAQSQRPTEASAKATRAAAHLAGLPVLGGSK